MPRREFRARTTIEATPEAIWAILTDAASYPEWDPYCERIEGRIAPGEKLKAYSKLAPGRAFAVKVMRFEPQQAMTWEAGMPLGLFKGVRSFELTPKGDVVEFSVGEVFSGPMLALIGKSLPDMSEPFEEFAAGLKARAEGKR